MSSKNNGNIKINIQDMDELSIDSATNLKINQIKQQSTMSSANKQQRLQQNNVKDLLKVNTTYPNQRGRQQHQQQQHHHQQQQQQQPKLDRSHFRIDWRQISYYQRPESYLSKFMGNFVKTGNEREQSSFSAEHDCDDPTTRVMNGNIHDLDEKLKNHKEPKQILNSLDGCFKSGQLNAILGPSGAGKSTFLSTLFGSKQDSAFGQTKVTWFNDTTTITNDNKNNQSTKNIKRRPIRIASLPQYDHLLNHLTVYECLMFASKIKNNDKSRQLSSSNNKNKNFHRSNVKRVAKMLKLTDCLDTRCGKLSGGQYKRVSIGQELLSEPDVIILDEPTSGLDAMTCLSTIQTLKSIVLKHPICIILTIHQPDNDVFTLFDHVYVIAQGGIAIYEGPPGNIIPTLAKVNLHLPSPNYNPARFIIEHAFVIEPEPYDQATSPNSPLIKRSLIAPPTWSSGGIEQQGRICKNPDIEIGNINENDEDYDDEDDDDDDDDDDEDENNIDMDKQSKHSYIKRSVLSLTEAISGKEMKSTNKDKKPLLNIAIQTLDGKLITTEQLIRSKERMLRAERWNLLRRLNEIQKSPYRKEKGLIDSNGFKFATTSTDSSSTSSCGGEESSKGNMLSNSYKASDSGNISPNVTTVIAAATTRTPLKKSGLNEKQVVKHTTTTTTPTTMRTSEQGNNQKSAKSDYSSSMWSSSDNQRLECPNSDRDHERIAINDTSLNEKSNIIINKATSLAQLTYPENIQFDKKLSGRSLQVMNDINNCANVKLIDDDDDDNESIISSSSSSDETSGFVVNLKGSVTKDSGNSTSDTSSTTISTSTSTSNGLNEEHGKQDDMSRKRQFDKQLSAKHNCSKQKDYPHWEHAFLLTHRTWLSIVRDPVFFGIQFAMHTIIPILLSAIFGSVQEEGCPRIGNFDLVDFAYSDTENFFQGTVSSIRQSIGNIGIVFFEMFCLIFAINCITAMVFPSDMHILLKEYRNGWYSLRSYFIGRTLADLPVPIILHTFGISTLYYLTGQPLTWFRYGGTVLLVILASLIAQSIGLTIGAILMTSSQSAVLAAAGIVSPFFALSGFIVRIHTLPIIAQIAAQTSYMYHLLNGFIVLRYGFDRCECNVEDFESDSTHQIPSNLHTLASMWIGTYSNEYANSNSVTSITNNNTLLGGGGGGANINNINNNSRTNVDPNIDVVDKMMTAFKMANSYGHQIQDCNDVLPYAMLEFNLRDSDLLKCFIILIIMVILSRLITFSSIYYKIRSYT